MALRIAPIDNSSWLAPAALAAHLRAQAGASIGQGIQAVGTGIGDAIQHTADQKHQDALIKEQQRIQQEEFGKTFGLHQQEFQANEAQRTVDNSRANATILERLLKQHQVSGAMAEQSQPGWGDTDAGKAHAAETTRLTGALHEAMLKAISGQQTGQAGVPGSGYFDPTTDIGRERQAARNAMGDVAVAAPSNPVGALTAELQSRGDMGGRATGALDFGGGAPMAPGAVGALSRELMNRGGDGGRVGGTLDFSPAAPAAAPKVPVSRELETISGETAMAQLELQHLQERMKEYDTGAVIAPPGFNRASMDAKQRTLVDKITRGHARVKALSDIQTTDENIRQATSIATANRSATGEAKWNVAYGKLSSRDPEGAAELLHAVEKGDIDPQTAAGIANDRHAQFVKRDTLDWNNQAKEQYDAVIRARNVKDEQARSDRDKSFTREMKGLAEDKANVATITARYKDLLAQKTRVVQVLQDDLALLDKEVKDFGNDDGKLAKRVSDREATQAKYDSAKDSMVGAMAASEKWNTSRQVIEIDEYNKKPVTTVTEPVKPTAGKTAPEPTDQPVRFDTWDDMQKAFLSDPEVKALPVGSDARKVLAEKYKARLKKAP